MKLNFKPRPAKPGDIPGVHSLIQSCGLHIEDLSGQVGEAYCVVEDQDEIIAVCGLEAHGPYGLIRSVAVAPSFRGYAVGEALVKNRLARAAALNLSPVYLLTLDADKYFERFGFKVIDRGEVPQEVKASYEFSVLCPGTAIVMRFELETNGRE